MNQVLFGELFLLKHRDLDTHSMLIAEGRHYEGFMDEMQQLHKDETWRWMKLVSQYGWPCCRLPAGERANFSSP